MRIVLGIGNPGRKYAGTRHNVGFRTVDALCEKRGKKFRKMGFEFAGVEMRLAGEEAVLVRPWTYVNGTGRVVPELRKRFGELGANFLVVCDDFALPLDALRLRAKGSGGGHKGLGSIIGALGSEDFARLRIGIGFPAGEAADYVLARFRRAERGTVARVIDDAVAAIECWAEEGVEAAMSRFNRTPKDPEDEKD
ncbi:MAG: aminoacyl-tRNA hydrolase [Planctomycetota bacterium]|jgi:PTH1 family peptidyl-tRNA hydrolase